MSQKPSSLADDDTNTSVSASRKSLLELLNDGSDVYLVFTAADESTETVSAHSIVLKQWSRVLAEALDADITGIGSSGSGKGSLSRVSISMYGTCKEDWLLAMEMMHPVIPEPVLTWDKVETLLVIADKYNMPALMQRLQKFVGQHTNDVSLDSTSNLFVWKWVAISDRYGMHDISRVCMDVYAGQDVYYLFKVLPQQQLHQLSSRTLEHLVAMMYAQLPKPGYYCLFCKSVKQSDKLRWDHMSRSMCRDCRRPVDTVFRG